MLINPPFPVPVRVLLFGNVPLQPAGRDSWILPDGQGQATTAELRRMANVRGIKQCLVFERLETRNFKSLLEFEYEHG